MRSRRRALRFSWPHAPEAGRPTTRTSSARRTHPILWRGGWGLWIAAALSLLAFYAWWGSRLGAPAWGVAAFLVALAGLACDLSAESLFIGWLPDHLEAVHLQVERDEPAHRETAVRDHPRLRDERGASA